MTTGGVRVSVFAKTDLGRTRDQNEDAFLVADLTSGHASLQPDVRRHVVGERGSLFLVADGMGGAAGGEVASAMATDLVFRHMSTAWTSDADRSAERFAYRMREAVERANERIHAHAGEHPEVRGMGTTLTAAGIMGRELFLSQVGDSRAYLVRAGEAIQLTKDQSLTQRLVDAGELTEEEAEQSERRNIILQALGPEPRVKVDLTRQPLGRGDTLILCSDGLSGQVRREELAQMAADHPEPADLCGALVDLANDRGGPDNITVVVVRFDGDGLEEPDGVEPAAHRTFELDSAEFSAEPGPGALVPGALVPGALAPGALAPGALASSDDVPVGAVPPGSVGAVPPGSVGAVPPGSVGAVPPGSAGALDPDTPAPPAAPRSRAPLLVVLVAILAALALLLVVRR